MRGIRVARCIALLGLAVALTMTAAPAEAQYFGRNKVEYRDFDYRLLRTDHFDIYYDRQDERSARHAARMAERWYMRLSRLLDHEFETRQPVMLYGSHPAFGQTNVVSGLLDESIGGVTESGRRRIAMPFAASLADTNHVLGHEIVHAFQFDMARRNRISRAFPLWFAEGMAEYLSVGGRDPLTAAWLRDALDEEAFPTIDKLSKSRVAPYRFGHAVWAWLVSEFGEETVREMLRRPPSGKSGKVLARLAEVTGRSIEELSNAWAEDVRATVVPKEKEAPFSRTLVTSRSGRLHIAPALSPDGTRIAFVSERDGFSIDLYVADSATGKPIRKLLTSTSDVELESLQYVHSAGAWRRDGRQIAFAAVRTGASVLLLIDPDTGQREREIRFPQFGEVLTPTWSPDGNAIAFAALDGGVTDLYLYELGSESLRRITHDAYADLQPAWSPDGRHLVFATDRFSSDLDRLEFGPLQLAMLDVGDGSIDPLGTMAGAKAINPQWSADGASLFFIADPHGVSDVYRLELASNEVTRVTATSTSVTGLTASSPALTVAADTGTVAFSMLRHGRFEIRAIDPGAMTHVGQGLSRASEVGQGFGPACCDAARDRDAHDLGRLASTSPGGTLVSDMLADAEQGLPASGTGEPRDYRPRLGLDGVAQPFLSSGSNRFGSYLRAGASLLFDDLMGEQVLGIGWQAGTRIWDLAIDVRYLNRERRWNWGVGAELTPVVRTRSVGEMVELDGRRALERDTELRLQTSTKFGGWLAYPFSRARRVEFGGGVRHIEFEREMRSQTRFLPSGRLLSESSQDLPSGEDVLLGEASVAYVHDSARWGVASPRMGSRWRVEATQAVGELSFTTLSADYRRYFMPAKPVTVAARIAPSVRLGGQADDPRLFPMYIGSRVPVRGYYGRTLTAGCAARAAEGCIAGDDLFGHRIVAANLEVRVPFNLLPSSATLPLRAEALAFADAAFLWSSDPTAEGGLAEHRIRSVGLGIRLNALGMLFELDAVKPLDTFRNGWTIGVYARPGF
jgi:Tol biopolymer transport system component